MTMHSGIVAAVTLPWPSSDLSPNSRLHWARKSRVAKKARNDARLLCLAEGIRGLGWDRARVSVTFHAPDNRRRDSDNLLSSLKSALDGIADATGIDDSRWSLQIERGEIVPGGSVVVRLSPIGGAE
ncbi:endonuclease [Pelagibacterium sp. 26DY04]|uniref:endonuclease n=1 Tax=Pelagibacterium sp. 26DY04 TaxID=2967130 RepID=UPI002814E6C7|nr:endonuclease [Pelagibacterium sp. 26DY04]WMT88258.1 endonuclease [Pelagibacterium sp. 26DY04]